MGIVQMTAARVRRRAIFLDRDGVLNRAVVRAGKPYPPADVAQTEILPGVAEALAQLRAVGFVLIVVSNQPDVARGTTARATVEAINAYLGSLLPVDRFIMCYEDGENAFCKKPNPGMLLAGAQEFNVDLSQSFMIGDRWRDVEAGIAAGCRTVFINCGYAEKQPTTYDFQASSLLDAATLVLSATPPFTT
jgi:D-glycero-D-manno-heptose 1,7-bisphosphate phosphatase